MQCVGRQFAKLCGSSANLSAGRERLCELEDKAGNSSLLSKVTGAISGPIGGVDALLIEQNRKDRDDEDHDGRGASSNE